MIQFLKKNRQEKKLNELGIKFSFLTYLFDVNEFATLEYERLLNKRSSLGVSIGFNTITPVDGYQEIDKPISNIPLFGMPDKFYFVVQPYYRYFLERDTKVCSG